MSLIGGIGSLLGGAVKQVTSSVASGIGANLASKVAGSGGSSVQTSAIYSLRDQNVMEMAQLTEQAKAEQSRHEFNKEAIKQQTELEIARMQSEATVMKTAAEMQKRQVQAQRAALSAQQMEADRQSSQVTSLMTALMLQQSSQPQPVSPVVIQTGSQSQPVVQKATNYMPIYIGIAVLAGLILVMRKD